MDLFEVFESHCLQLGVIDILIKDFITLCSDVNHSPNNFLLNVESVEAEVAKLLGEIMWWDRNHCEVGDRWRRLLGREVKVSSNEVPVLLFHVLVENDLVHSSREV